MADYLPLTELEAVNLMLEGVGESPVYQLTDTGIADVEIAISVLHNTSRNLQTRGWTFNSESDYPLTKDVDGYIFVPLNCLKVDAYDPTVDVVWRGEKLYDKKNHTYIFEDDLKVEIVFFLPFEELPQAARTYIYILASRDFQKKVLGSETITSFTKEDEEAARTLFLESEDDAGDFNIFQSYDTARPIMRNFNPLPRGGY